MVVSFFIEEKFKPGASLGFINFVHHKYLVNCLGVGVTYCQSDNGNHKKKSNLILKRHIPKFYIENKPKKNKQKKKRE